MTNVAKWDRSCQREAFAYAERIIRQGIKCKLYRDATHWIVEKV